MKFELGNVGSVGSLKRIQFVPAARPDAHTPKHSADLIPLNDVVEVRLNPYGIPASSLVGLSTDRLIVDRC
jgi:hypothetical protein